MILNEHEIYSFNKCSFYTNYFKEKYPYPEKYNIFSNVLDKIFIAHLKSQNTKNIESISYTCMLDLFNKIKNTEDFLPQQIKKSINSYTIILSQFLSILGLHEKIPVFGPTYHYYSFGKKNLKIHNKCLYRTIEGEYISFYLSPYPTSFEAKNDPIPYVLWEILNEFISTSLGVNKTLIIKMLYINKNNEVLHEDIFCPEKKASTMLNSCLENIDLSKPRYGCSLHCKFKKECKIWKTF